MSSAADNLARAKRRYSEGGKTLVIVAGETLIEDGGRGIGFLARLAERGARFSEGGAADRIVGKAAAMLYLLLGVGAVYAETMSDEAANLLTSHGVKIECAVRADRIVNRAGTGLCPMEEAVENVSEPSEALAAILRKLREIGQKS